jgi:hypothetical protein
MVPEDAKEIMFRRHSLTVQPRGKRSPGFQSLSIQGSLSNSALSELDEFMQLAIRRSIFSFARMAAKELAFREPREDKNSIWAKEDSAGPCIPSSQDARFPAGLRTDDIDRDALSIGCLGVSCFPGCLDPPTLHMSMSCPTPNTLATRRRQKVDRCQGRLRVCISRADEMRADAQ